MISTPRRSQNRLKFIQLSLLEKTKLLCVVVLEGNVIKNKIISLGQEIDNEMLLKLNILFNSSLNGLIIEEINLSIISKMAAQAGEYSSLVRDILDAIAQVLHSQEDLKIYTSGATNIFKYPELSDSTRASELICTLEEKQLLTTFIQDEGSEDGKMGIQVYIGDETPVQSMKDCSVVTATYELEDGMRGTIGIIGPKRMDYEKVVETLKNVKDQLDSAFKKSD